jgi:exodeoxyribonuclease VII large subunit
MSSADIMGASAAAPTPPVFTVTRLNREVRTLLERGLGVVWVEGELSNLAQPASGHWYFSLKDREAQVRCAMFRMRTSGVTFTPKAGQQVLARGRVSLYEPRGDYQLIVEHLEEAGVGALQREFERLKAKLAAEGLFAREAKRALPRFPRRIGVVTSPTGAAIRDVLHILGRRFPPAAVRIYPVPVQGAAAAPAIVEALALASQRADCDVLILARGGGSLEDLWAFNDEHLARAIRACTVPVVSGVGHEIDFTIADFAADARAPTPSGAAELVAPDRQALLEALQRTGARIGATMNRELRAAAARFEAASARLTRADPGLRLAHQAQRLDDLEQRLTLAVRSAVQEARHRLTRCEARLLPHSPQRRTDALRARIDALAVRLERHMSAELSQLDHRVMLAQRTLQTASPLATLARGFAIVTRADGSLLRDTAAVRPGELIEARVASGRLQAQVGRVFGPEEEG